MKSELLSPAKNKEIAIAAIDCGADAVYIGASNFGARKKAGNTLEDIKEVVDYAHLYWVKVFITVNTILTNDEIEEAVKLIKELINIGVDAIIIQDMGLLYKIIEENIKIPIHISTQCDNRDLEKIKFFNEVGVNRVVLPRETSLDKIKEIKKLNPNLELEAFVHGALCVSYSGQCYLSQFIGGRSANRGECAQPCRKKYSIKNDKNEIIAKDLYALCLKDFNASKHIEQMLKNGIFSFKIEGRLKDINYVKNITAYYRQLLDKYSEKISSGTSIYEFEPNQEKSFNRDFTDYFLEKRKECFNFKSQKSKGEFLGKVISIKNNCFKLKTDKTINNQDGLTFENDGFLVNKIEKGYIYPNKKIDIKLGMKVYRNNDVNFEKIVSKKTKRKINIDIVIENNIISIIDEDGVTVSIQIPMGEIPNNKEKMKENFIKQITKMGESIYSVKNIEIKSEIPFLPVSVINELRRNLVEKLSVERLKHYNLKRDSVNPLNYTPYYKKTLDYKSNVHNNYAEKFYNKCSASVEQYSLESNKINSHIELMRTKHCIKYALDMCKTKDKLFLIDEKNIEYPLFFDCKNCEMVVLSN